MAIFAGFINYYGTEYCVWGFFVSKDQLNFTLEKFVVCFLMASSWRIRFFEVPDGWQIESDESK